MGTPFFVLTVKQPDNPKDKIIMGAAIGAVGLLAALAACVVFALIRKRRSKFTVHILKNKSEIRFPLFSPRNFL